MAMHLILASLFLPVVVVATSDLLCQFPPDFQGNVTTFYKETGFMSYYQFTTSSDRSRVYMTPRFSTGQDQNTTLFTLNEGGAVYRHSPDGECKVLHVPGITFPNSVPASAVFYKSHSHDYDIYDVKKPTGELYSRYIIKIRDDGYCVPQLAVYYPTNRYWIFNPSVINHTPDFDATC